MKKNLTTLAIIVLAILVYLLHRPGRQQTTPYAPAPSAANAPVQPQATATTTQPFDYFLLNLSWSPEFCSTHPGKPECSQHLGFVLHGLWPQNTNGTYPQNCSTAPGPEDPTQYSDIYPDLSLLQHEWQTHGTCSGLAPDAYFTLARQALHSVAIPTEISSLHQQTSLPPGQILSLFSTSNPTFPAGSLALSCGNNYLTAVEVCLNKSAQPISCGPIPSCRANTVRIIPPQS